MNKSGRAVVAEITDPVELSVRYFVDGLYCSEAIMRAFNEVYELGLAESAYRIATPFGAGMGVAKCSCGAVTGGLLVLGLTHGRDGVGDSELPAFDVAKELHDRFRARYRAICCRVLTRRLVWGEPEHHEKCQEYVRFAAETIRSLITGPVPGAPQSPSLEGVIEGEADDPCARCGTSGQGSEG